MMKLIVKIACLLLAVYAIAQSLSSGSYGLHIYMQQQHERFPLTVSSDNDVIFIHALKHGQIYNVTWTTSSTPKNKILPDQDFPPSTDLYDHFRFRADDSIATIKLNATSMEFGHLSVSCMSCPSAVTSRRSPGSIETQGGLSAAQLIQDVFVGGNCYDVENVTLTGLQAMIGTFSNGNSSIGMSEGVVISTGRITQIPGPNSTTGISDDMGLTFQDPDLDLLSLNALFDVASIEFDFRPKGDSVSFKYAFASDEYCEFNFSQFNDKFGFFISGPGINGPYTNGADNIAIVPGLTEVVSINSVNIEMNSAFYVDNVPLGQFQNPAGPYHCNPDLAMQGLAINAIEYDGFTTVLTAKTEVIPCELYHIKLVIADQSDGIFDSSVFLEKNSFNSGGNVEVEISYVRPGDEYIYEGCSEGFITFSRALIDDISEDLVINYSISPSSTATSVIDYIAIPNPLIIPAGEISVQIPLIAFEDGIPEGLESIILSIENSCRCENDEIEIVISDLDPLAISPDHQQYCETTSVTVNANSSGGLDPISYEWSTGATEPSISMTLASTDTFYVTVTDDCGNMLDTFSIVEIINENSARFDSEDIEFCPGDEINTSVDIIYDGSIPFTIYIARDGEIIDTLIGTDNVINYPITQAGVYSISSVQAIDCHINPVDEFEVRIIELSFTGEVTHIDCDSDQLGEIELNVIGENPPYTFHWSDGFITSNPSAAFLEGSYSVTVTDFAHCSVSDTFEIIKRTGPELTLDSIRHITCRNEFGFAAIRASGGSGNYSIMWLELADTARVQDGLNEGTYSIELTDLELFCTDTVSLTIEDQSELFSIDIFGDTLNCNHQTATLKINLINSFPYEISWYDESGNVLNAPLDTLINLDQQGKYFATVTNSNTGCTAVDSFELPYYSFQPSAVAGADAILNCRFDEIILDGSNSVYSPTTTITWSSTDGNFIQDADSIRALVNSPGEYILALHDEQSLCSSQDTLIVHEPSDRPNVLITPPGVLNCDNVEILVDASSSDSSEHIQFTWSGLGGNFIETSHALQILTRDTGWLVLEIMDTISFCSGVDSIYIQSDFEQPIVFVSEDDTMTCLDNSLVISGLGSSSGLEFTYNWQTPNGHIIGPVNQVETSVSAPGIYILTVINTTNGCRSVDSLQIYPDERLPEIIVAKPDSITCINSLVLIDAQGSSSGSAFIYEWSTANGSIIGRTDTSIIQVVTAGTYLLNITNISNGCTNSQSVVVAENLDVPIISFDTPLLLTCENSQTSINAENSSTGSEFIYNWSTHTGSILSGEHSLHPLVNEAAYYTLEIINSQNGCRSIDSIFIDEDLSPPEIINANEYELTCAIHEILITAEIANSADVRYDWTLPNGVAIMDASSSITVSEIGDVLLTVTSLDNGCSNQAIYTITENREIPELVVPPIFVVDCGPFIQELVANTNLTMDYEIAWSALDGGIISNPSQLNIHVNTLGTYQVDIVNLANGCGNTAFVDVVNNGEITADLTIQQPLCDDLAGVIDLAETTTGTPPYSYGLNGAAVSETTWPITLSSGQYDIEIMDSEGCVDNLSFTILPPRQLELAFDAIDTLKIGTSIQLIPQLNIDPEEIFMFEWTPPLYLDDALVLDPWSTPLDNITYTLTITDTAGCYASAIVQIILDKTIRYYVPNVFSPNDDLINDRVTIFTNEHVDEIVSFQIYNRWGSRVYEHYNFPPNDLTFGWDGYFNDQLMDPAVFVYQAELHTVFGEIISIQGDITLLR